MKPKLQRFAAQPLLFGCPLCQHPLALNDNQLCCSHHHSFDLARFGYVNLALKQAHSDGYDKKSFTQRQFILEAGFYDHILDTIVKLMKQYQPQTILDVACGEGFYSRQLENGYDGDFYAFDLSKESIQLASKHDQRWKIKWFVADLAHIPLQNHSMDMILDIFSPANYSEFHRLLADGGYVIKVIPNQYHLHELRQYLSKEKQVYSNQNIVDVFKEHLEVVEKLTVHQTRSLNEEERQALVEMTPLLFNEEKHRSFEGLTEITIGADILIGRKK